MIQKTGQYIKEQKLLLPGEKVVTGLSGGADSVCLLHILKELGVELAAVHVNHKIRGEEADRDEAFARALCESLEIPFFCYHFDIPAISRERGWSVEEAGRRMRRQAFSEVKEQWNASKIALAHHGNDRAETLLFHLCRGTGLKGLVSMKPAEDCYIRPLLWAGRQDIEAYVRDRGIAFVEDSTNAQDCYTRNRIRHQVLPVLETVNSECIGHICGAAEKLTAVEAYLSRQAEAVFACAAVLGQEEIAVSKAELFQADEVLWIPVLQKCVEDLKGSLINMTEEHWGQLIRLFERQTGKELTLPEGLRAARTYEGIRLFRCRKEELPDEAEAEVPGHVKFLGQQFSFSLEMKGENENFPSNPYTKYFDYDKIGGRICLRTRKKGDYLEINKDHGKKSLQDYLVNEKVPKEQRDRVVLLTEGSHILWVVGKRISEYYKVTGETKRILKVQWNGETENE